MSGVGPTPTVQAVTLQDVLARVQQLLPAAAQPAAPALSTDGFAAALAQATSSPTPPSTSTSSSATLATPTAYAPEIDAAGARYGVDPLLIRSVIAQESGGNPSATSAAGAQGLMQLMPQTASSLGVTDPYDPAQSIDAGARYLRGQLDRFGGDTSLALAAYNAGAGAVEHYGGIPPFGETQNYVQQVLGRYERLTNQGSDER